MLHHSRLPLSYHPKGNPSEWPRGGLVPTGLKQCPCLPHGLDPLLSTHLYNPPCKQSVEDVDLSLLDGTDPYDLFRPDGAKRFGPKLTNALADARREGHEEGRQEAFQYNIVSRMLAKGMDWEVIEEYTSVDEARYRELARYMADIKDSDSN